MTELHSTLYTLHIHICYYEARTINDTEFLEFYCWTETTLALQRISEVGILEIGQILERLRDQYGPLHSASDLRVNSDSVHRDAVEQYLSLCFF